MGLPIRKGRPGVVLNSVSNWWLDLTNLVLAYVRECDGPSLMSRDAPNLLNQKILAGQRQVCSKVLRQAYRFIMYNVFMQNLSL
jgi:hypothetical protein